MSYLKRLSLLQKTLKDSSCDAILVDDMVNIYYLTGLDLSAGKLLVHTQGANLIVDNRYLEMCKKYSPFPVTQSDTLKIEPLLNSPELAFIKTLAFDSDSTSYKSFLQLEKISQELAKDSRQLSLLPLDNPVKKLRAIKESQEITTLQEAANLGAQGFDFVCSLLKEGISEWDVAIELEIFWKQRGGRTVAFDPIIAFGPNSSMPHYRAGNAKLKKGEAVLVDIGVNLNHYHSDMTRMVYFGQPDPRMLEIHSIVQEAQQIALSHCHPGTLIGDLDGAARDYISSKGYGPNFSHSLGHGVGLEIHELPVIKNAQPYKDIALAAGMVITIEPGIYLNGIGGVRIEDTVAITTKGHTNLTQRTPNPIFI